MTVRQSTFLSADATDGVRDDGGTTGPGRKRDSSRKGRRTLWAALGAMVLAAAVGTALVASDLPAKASPRDGDYRVAAGDWSPRATEPAADPNPLGVAGERLSQGMAESIYGDGVDTPAELASYEATGTFNGDEVMVHLKPMVAKAEAKRVAAREAAERKARQAAEAKAAAAARKAAKAAGKSGSRSKGSGAVTVASVPDGHGGTWSESKVRGTLAAAADEYGIRGGDREWIIDAGTRVARRESTFNTQARNGQHLGLFQFNSAWGPASSRLDGVWSCYRFVRVFRDGGKSKIQQHWKATL